MDSEKDERTFELMKAEDRAAALSSEASVFLNVAKFEQMNRVATMLSKTDFIPERFRGNVGNCMIALDMASLMGMHPVMLMRTMYVVHGQPGFEGKFTSALINNSRRYVDPLEYEWKGEKGKPTWGCRAFAVRRSTGKTITGPWVDWAMVEREGWSKDKVKNGITYKSKWNTMPEIMFMYRAATFFGRVHDSDLLMGMQTIDEIEDTHAELIRRPDGSYSMPANEKPNAETYAVNANPPQPQQSEESPAAKKGLPHLRMPDPVTIAFDEKSANETEKEPSEFMPSKMVDEFGTDKESVFEKSKWFHLRAGSPQDGTGFAAYVKANAEHLSGVSQVTFNAMFDKYKKLYGKDFPWSPHGYPVDFDYKTGPIEPEIPEGVQSEGNDPDADPGEGAAVADPDGNEAEIPLLETEAAKTLAGLAGKHRREYIMVVKNRVPQSIEQIFEWIDAINQLVIDYARQHAQAQHGATIPDQW